MAGAIQYFEHRDITIPEVTADENVGAGEEYEIELINQVFGSGSQDGNPFAVFYEGAIQLDVDPGGNYNFTLSTQHTFADGSTYDSPDRMLTFRLARNAEYSVPIGAFSSISTIPSGTYTDEQLNGDVTIRSSLKVSHSNPATGWDLEMLQGQLLAVSYIQWYDGRRPVVALPVADARPTLKESIDTYFEAAGWAVSTWDKPVRSMNSIESRWRGQFALSTSPTLVPRVEVRVTMQVGKDDPDVEQKYRDVVAMLNKVPNCYPDLSPTNARYRDRTVQFTVVCNGI